MDDLKFYKKCVLLKSPLKIKSLREFNLKRELLQLILENNSTIYEEIWLLIILGIGSIICGLSFMMR